MLPAAGPARRLWRRGPPSPRYEVFTVELVDLAEGERVVTLQRWGIESCSWRASDGRTYGESESVGLGTEAVMHARLWGFPDTTRWLFFKRPQARFTVWERDPGGRPTPEDVDTLENNDDEGESSDADVKSDETAARWTTVYEDEFDPLDLHVNAAEYYFEVSVEDQVCTSGEVLVY